MYVANKQTASEALKLLPMHVDQGMVPERRLAILHVGEHGNAYMPLVNKWSSDAKKYRRDLK